MVEAGGGGRVRLYAVFNVETEWGYPGDAWSPPRRAVDFTLHARPEGAWARLLAELDHGMEEQAALGLRRSHLVEVDVPAEMCGRGAARRWVADRAEAILRRAGIPPAADSLAPDLPAGLLADLGRAARAALAGAGAPPAAPHERLVAAAMEAAGACARARHHGALDAAAAGAITNACRDLAAAAWAGESTAACAEALARALGARETGLEAAHAASEPPFAAAA